MRSTLLLLALILTASLQAAAPVRKLVLAYAPKESLDFRLIATYDRARGWRGAEEAEGAVGTRQYIVYGLGANLGPIEGSQPRPRGEDGVVGRLPRKLYRDCILINGDQPDMCPVTRGDESATETVTAYLKSRGVEVERAQLEQNLKVDLDGDGRPERLIVAAHRDPYSDEKKPGDYSLAAVLREGNVEPLEFQSARVEADLPWEDYQVLLVGHLDGQGTAEIVLSYSYYEGGGVLVLGHQGEAWKVLARADWGL